MQQKLILLAVAAFASGAAFAQTNRPASSQQQQQRPAQSSGSASTQANRPAQSQPQKPVQATPAKPVLSLYGTDISIYGTADVGVTHRRDAKRTVDPNNLRLSPPGPHTAIDSGLSEPSMLGFKAEKNLGNGTKALVVLETMYKSDLGTQWDKRFSPAYVGLSGGFGTAIAGRLVAPLYAFQKDLDPFNDGTVGRSMNAVFEGDYTEFVDNAIAYVSPSMGGFTITGAFSTNAGGMDNYDNNDGDARVFTVLPRYTKGSFDAGAGLQYVNIKGSDPTTWGLKMLLGASYDFRLIKLSTAYNYIQTDGAAERKMHTMLVGVSVPFGKHAIQTSLNMSKIMDVGDAGLFAVGYTYTLYEGLNFFAAFARAENDDGRLVGTADASNPGAYCHGDENCFTGVDAGVWRTAIQAGLKYKF